MLTEDGFAFFHRILFLVNKLRLHLFVVRNDLLFNAECKRTHLIGWTNVIMDILYFPLVIGRIEEAGKIEGITHFRVSRHSAPGAGCRAGTRHGTSEKCRVGWSAPARHPCNPGAGGSQIPAPGTRSLCSKEPGAVGVRNF